MHILGSLLVYAIKDEHWYEFCEKFLKDASAGGTPMDKKTFLTTMKNPVTKQFEQLEFDASQFRHDHHSGVRTVHYRLGRRILSSEEILGFILSSGVSEYVL